MSLPELYACIEAGGTKFLVGIAGGPDDVRETVRIPTTEPVETLAAVIDWLLHAQERHGRASAAGIASFGPLQIDQTVSDWGHITSTPKPGWSNVDLVGPVAGALGLPVAIDTDVNAAAMAECRWGAGIGSQSLVYFTVGTGIGGGAVISGNTIRGLGHPEMGHALAPRHPADDFAGICPFHETCYEGLASGLAINARWGASLDELGPDHEANEIIAWYLANLVISAQAFLAPERIVLGGGVLGMPGLFDRVRTAASDIAAGYFTGKIADVLVEPGLRDRSGLLGALALASDVRGSHSSLLG